MAKGMGFKAAQKQVAKSVTPRAGQTKMEAAAGVVAAAARNASPAAKKANPNLKNVAMPKKK